MKYLKIIGLSILILSLFKFSTGAERVVVAEMVTDEG